MKVLLLEDVYNLGRAGEVKKVANGYGRNFLLPQGLAALATSAALAGAEDIVKAADEKRATLNNEMSGVSEKFTDLKLLFSARAGETGKLYGSVTSQTLADKLNEELGLEISKRQIDAQPLRQLGMHTVKVRLTMDLIPEFSAVVYREGENPENYMVEAEELAAMGQSGQSVEEAIAAEAEAMEEEAVEEETADQVEEVSEETEDVIEEEIVEAAEEAIAEEATDEEAAE